MTAAELRALITTTFEGVTEETAIEFVAERLRQIPPKLNGADAVDRATARSVLLDFFKAKKVLGATALVDAALEQSNGRHSQTAASTDPEPHPEPQDGAALLDEMAAFFTRYMVLPSAHAATCLAAFVVLTYGVDAFDAVPYLAVLSPTLRCGKSRLLELLELLAWRPWLTTAATGAVIYRKIERLHPTVLIDEAEVVRQKSDAGGIVRALLQAGYKRGVKVTRCVGDDFEDRDFDVFGPKVFAAIGQLAGSLLDRCVVLELRRRRRDEPVARLRKREVAPRVLEFRQRARRWAIDHRHALERSRPPLPDALDDRAHEIWEPLLAIGERAGGDWLGRLTAAALALSGGRDDDSLGAELLADIHATFTERKVDRLTSAELARALAEREGRPWAEWSRQDKPLTANGLARLLKDFGIAPTQLWIVDEDHPKGANLRGYSVASFADAFSRYLFQPPLPTARPLEPNCGAGNPAETQPLEPAPLAVAKPPENPRGDRVPSGLAVESPPLQGNPEDLSVAPDDGYAEEEQRAIREEPPPEPPKGDAEPDPEGLFGPEAEP